MARALTTKLTRGISKLAFAQRNLDNFQIALAKSPLRRTFFLNECRFCNAENLDPENGKPLLPRQHWPIDYKRLFRAFQKNYGRRC